MNVGMFQTLAADRNKIARIPFGYFSKAEFMSRLNLENNQLKSLPLGESSHYSHPSLVPFNCGTLETASEYFRQSRTLYSTFILQLISRQRLSRRPVQG